MNTLYNYLLLSVALIGFRGSVFSDDIYNIDNDVVIGSNVIGLATFGIGTAIYFAQDGSSLLDLEALDPADIPFYDRIALGKSSDSYSLASDILLYGLLTEAGLINFRNIGELRPFESPLLPTFLTSTGLNLLTKSTVRRARPYAYESAIENEKKTSADATFSFYSGHTSGAFTAAVYSSMMYEALDYPSEYRGYVWGANLLAASSTGVLRILSGNHFPSDVVVGAAIGSLIGWGFPVIYINNVHKSKQVQSTAPSKAGFELSAQLPSIRVVNIPISF